MGGKDKDKKKDKDKNKNKNKDKDKKKDKNKSSFSTGQKVALGGAAAIALAGVAAVGATVVGVGGYKIYQSQQGEAQDKSPLKLRIRIISGHNLQAADSGGVSDPYVVITQGQVSVKSEVRQKTVNPVWNQDLEMGVYEQDVLAKELKVAVFDKDMLSDDSLGTGTIALNSIPHDRPREFEVRLVGGQKGQNHGMIKLALHFARAGGAPHGGPPGGQGWSPQQQGGHPPQYGSGPQAYGSQPGGYPPQQGFPPQQGGYPPQHGGGPPAYGSQPGGYPPQHGFPPQQGGYPPQQGGQWNAPGGGQRDLNVSGGTPYDSQGTPAAYGSQPGAYGSQPGGYGTPPQDPSAGSGSGSLYTF